MHQHEEKRITKKRFEQELAAPFLAVLAMMTVIAFLLPLRPTTSVREKRVLREFPAFSFGKLVSGDYFDGITASGRRTAGMC